MSPASFLPQRDLVRQTEGIHEDNHFTSWISSTNTPMLLFFNNTPMWRKIPLPPHRPESPGEDSALFSICVSHCHRTTGFLCSYLIVSKAASSQLLQMFINEPSHLPSHFRLPDSSVTPRHRHHVCCPTAGHQSSQTFHLIHSLVCPVAVVLPSPRP